MKHLLASFAFTLSLSALYGADYFTQPTDDPELRKWQAGEQPLPPLAEIIARPAQDVPVFGIYLWGSEYELAWQEINKMGVRTLRMSGPTVEANKALKIAAENNVEIMYTVSSNATDEQNWRTKRRLPDFESEQAFLDNYRDTLNTFLDKYGPKGSLYNGKLKSPVAAIEITNEPNFQYIIPDRQPRPEVEAEREALYAKILPLAWDTVQAHPNKLPVVGFACGGGGATRADYRFVEGVFRDGGNSLAGDFDIFSTHPYTDGAPPEAYKIKPWGPVAVAKNTVEMEKLLAKHGAGGKPVWWTEVGYEMTHESGGKFPTDKKKQESLVNPELQMAYMIRTYLWAIRLGVDRVYLMHLHDTDNYNSGLMSREGFEWRPVAHAIKNITTLLPNPKLTGAQSDGEDDTYIYDFIADHKKGNQTDTVVAWNVLGPKEVKIKIPGGKATAKVYDIVGNEKTISARAGDTVTLEVGPYPIYIQAQ